MADLAAEYGSYAPQRPIARQGVGNEIRPCPKGLSVVSFGSCFSFFLFNPGKDMFTTGNDVFRMEASTNYYDLSSSSYLGGKLRLVFRKIS